MLTEKKDLGNFNHKSIEPDKMAYIMRHALLVGKVNSLLASGNSSAYSLCMSYSLDQDKA